MGKNKLILFILILLCGCSSDNDEIKFSENRTIQVGSEFNSCTLVEKVGDKEITKFDYDGNRILVNDRDAVTCPVVDTSKTGKREIRFKFKDKIYKIEVEIVDKTAPVINCKEKEIHISINETEKEILNYIEVVDYDEDIVVTVSGIEYGKAGKYTIEVKAMDSSGNVSKLQCDVIIEEIKESHDDAEPHENDPPIKNEIESAGQSSTKKPEHTETKEQPIKVKAENRRFLFPEGYDYTSCYNAALSYAKEAMANGLANGYTCEPIKNGKEYIGYEVVFK